MSCIGRFVVRDGLFVGVMDKEAMSNDTIKPDTVYEISGFLGELTIKEIGQSVIPKDNNDEIKGKTFEYGTWGSDIAHLMKDAGNNMLLTIGEYNKGRRYERT